MKHDDSTDDAIAATARQTLVSEMLRALTPEEVEMVGGGVASEYPLPTRP